MPYSYSQIITVNGRRDKTASNMAPFQYSQLEQQYIEEGGKVFPHIMGTDEMGRDYFVRVIYGTRVSLAVGLFASIIVLIIGVLYGSISGYFGGKVDLIMMRIVDIIYSLPDMLMVILLSVVLRETLNVDAIPFLQKLGPNMISMFIVFGLRTGQVWHVWSVDRSLPLNRTNTYWQPRSAAQNQEGSSADIFFPTVSA